MLEVISLGAGVQSSVMALMAASGEIKPMPDCAIFADTQFEPEPVYAHLDWLETQLPFPVHRVSQGSLKEAALEGGDGDFLIPFHSMGGMGRRTCTRHYKIDPLIKEVRRLLGLSYKQRGPKEIAVRQWMGISTDEASRMKPSPKHYIEYVWPLIDAGMSRQDCQKWFARHYPLRPLVKSACVACPFHNDRQWREMKLNDTRSFAEAVLFDKEIRINKTSGNKQFVHRSCKPLDEVDFRNLEDLGQINMFNEECEGMCGV
tara:strand:- start:321 stop:1100 length:780 start_codon:yes stop_codon:yes gene_type:complete